MVLTETDIQSFPFPYFYIDKQYNIINQSTVSHSFIQQKNNFLSLIATEFHTELIDYLNKSNSQAPLKLRFIQHDKTESYFYIYKQLDRKSGYIHVFCFQSMNEMASINRMVHYLEDRLEQFNEKIKQKRELLQQEIVDVKEEATGSEYMSSLAAGIAHEIRNPLTTIKGFIQLLKPYLNEIGKAYYADVALDEIDRANEIIYEFLNASKPQLGGKQGISLTKLLNDLFILYESEAILHNIELILVPSNENVLLTIDAQQIKQVFANVIKNAIEAIKDYSELKPTHRGIIKISTELTHDRVCIFITDNGAGMDEETVSKLFTPFYTTKKNGTGIGLSICKEIIDAHGGSIKADSNMKQGTTFTICLPVHPYEHDAS